EAVEAGGIAAGVAAVETLPPGVSAGQVEQGRELFVTCAVCHGLDAGGTQLGPSLRDAEWIHITGTLDEIEGVIRSGVPSPRTYPVPMAEMGGAGLDDEQLRAVASYVYAISRAAPASSPGSPGAAESIEAPGSPGPAAP